MKTALTIAGSDPTGGAGLQADLKVFRAFGIHGLSVSTALTAQNTTSIEDILPVEPKFFEKQMETLLSDIKPDAVKIGMIYSESLVFIIAEAIKRYLLDNIVVDPVTVSSTGFGLVDSGTLDRVRDVLFPLSMVVTPNIYEATVLTGVNIENETDMHEAARKLKDMGPQVVVITGGHLERITMDLYYDGYDFQRVESYKIKGEYHGTGCVFSSSIAAALATGYSPLESVRRAKGFVTDAISKAYHIGKGLGILQV
ncbi:MAG: bifunctional hydroxymethylpyrimidine kinase/phosphomethylpyrimidine kinase [Thermodesulfovibrionales bacterium]